MAKDRATERHKMVAARRLRGATVEVRVVRPEASHSYAGHHTRPLSPPREHSLGKVAPAIYDVKRVPRSKVHHVYSGQPHP